MVYSEEKFLNVKKITHSVFLIVILTGAWEAIKKDLEAIRRNTQTEALFHSGQILLNLKEANVLRQWRELGDEGELLQAFKPTLFFHIHKYIHTHSHTHIYK